MIQIGKDGQIRYISENQDFPYKVHSFFVQLSNSRGARLLDGKVFDRATDFALSKLNRFQEDTFSEMSRTKVKIAIYSLALFIILSGMSNHMSDPLVSMVVLTALIPLTAALYRNINLWNVLSAPPNPLIAQCALKERKKAELQAKVDSLEFFISQSPELKELLKNKGTEFSDFFIRPSPKPHNIVPTGLDDWNSRECILTIEIIHLESDLEYSFWFINRDSEILESFKKHVFEWLKKHPSVPMPALGMDQSTREGIEGLLGNLQIEEILPDTEQ